MSLAVRIYPEGLRTVASSTLTGSYQVFGSPFQNPICLMKIVNNSTNSVTISWDGVTDHDIVPSDSFVLYDITSQTQRSSGIYIDKGLQIWLKGTAGTGNLYLVSLYPRD